MRIAYIYGFKAFPPQGGNRLHAYQLARRFLANGHDLLTWGDDSIPGATCYPRTKEGAERLVREADVVYLRVDGNPIGADPMLTATLAHSTSPLVWEINAPANENLAFSWLGGNPVPKGKGLLRFLDRCKRAFHAGRQMLRILPEERLRRRLARRASAAVCVSDALARYATVGLGLSRVVTLPNGSDPEVNHPGREPARLPDRYRDHLKVLYAGSPIYPWQGLDIITKAIELQRCRQHVPIVFLLLMNQVTSDIPDGDNVHVLERVPYEDVATYINAADVCLAIHPEYPWSRWGFHNSPMKLFDYMACGRTVVASNVGQMRDVIRDGENGVLCENTPEDLLATLESLSGAHHRLERMGATARKDVLDRFNWDRIAAETLALFSQVIADGTVTAPQSRET